MTRIDFLNEMLSLMVEALSIPDVDKKEVIANYARSINLVIDKEIENEYK